MGSTTCVCILNRTACCYTKVKDYFRIIDSGPFGEWHFDHAKPRPFLSTR